MCFGASNTYDDFSWYTDAPSRYGHSCDALILEQDVKQQVYLKVRDLSQVYCGSMRLSGLGLGLASATLTLAFRVASVGETIIKGFANIFGGIAHVCGAPNCEKFNFFSGVKQILIALPGSLLNAGIWMPLEIIVVDILANSVKMLIEPEDWAEGRSQSYYGRKEMWTDIATPAFAFNKNQNLEKTLQVVYGP